jgi:hypothetical protein
MTTRAIAQVHDVNELRRIAMNLVSHRIRGSVSPQNQAGGRAMREQAPVAIGEASFGSANPAAAIQHFTVCLDPACSRRNGSHQ